MSPLEIRILLHYHSNVDDYKGTEPESFTEGLARQGLLEVDDTGDRRFDITTMGRCYVDYITKLPLPTLTYTMDRG